MRSVLFTREPCLRILLISTVLSSSSNLERKYQADRLLEQGETREILADAGKSRGDNWQSGTWALLREGFLG